MRALVRLPGPLLIATGALHLVVFLALFADAAAAMLRAAILNSLHRPDGPAVAEREALWYGGFWTAAMTILCGLAILHHTRSTGRPAPRHVGWALASFAALAGVVHPASGAWIPLAIGLLIALGPSDPGGHRTA